MSNLKDAFNQSLLNYAKANNHISADAIRAEMGDPYTSSTGYCDTCYYEFQGFELHYWTADGYKFTVRRDYDEPMSYMQSILDWEEADD